MITEFKREIKLYCNHQSYLKLRTKVTITDLVFEISYPAQQLDNETRTFISGSY